MLDYFHRAYVLGDESVIDEFIAPNVIAHGLAPEPLHGVAAFKEWYRRFRSSFSNITCPVTHAWAEGDWVIVRITFTGTHTGPSLGPPPTGKPVTLSALIAAREKDGKLVEGFNEFNQYALLQQIGAV
jgi:predicted ester cyclase